MHKYAIQITVADVRDGALSSSTLKEASSWGKVDTIFEQMVYSEATIAMPLVVGYAYHKGGWKKRKANNFTAKLDAQNRGAGMAKAKVEKVKAASETGKKKAKANGIRIGRVRGITKKYNGCHGSQCTHRPVPFIVSSQTLIPKIASGSPPPPSTQP